MDIDIQIYVKKLKDFFSNDEEARKDVFGSTNVDMSKFYDLVAQQAVINNKKLGDPTLSPPQLMEIMGELAIIEAVKELGPPRKEHLQDSDISKVFRQPLKKFPPFCLN
tara:strand:+ start:118 stop:444 length:327 start_codon:yes stop_codon:yes gene_type:complete